MARSAFLCALLGVTLAVVPASAQQEGTPPAGAATASTPAPPAPSPAPIQLPAGYPHLRVTGVVSQDAAHPKRAALGKALTLQVQELAAMISPDSQIHCSNLILFLDEIAIPGSPPESCSPAEGTVRFLLERTDKSDRAWHFLLKEPTRVAKIISASVGPNEELAYPTTVRDLELQIIPKGKFFSFLAMLALGLAVFVRLALKTALLRDPVPAPAGQLPPYSLSRFQLGFWTLLVLAAYVFIWMVTAQLDTITGSVLVLLGIGSGTALGATLIDSGKTAPAGSSPPAEPAAPAQPTASRGFLTDLLSDANGVSIYRFQLFAWTLILGVIFCASVYDGLQMPQFSTTLLGLMGLSSGTYLGFKVPENKEPAAGGTS